MKLCLFLEHVNIKQTPKSRSKKIHAFQSTTEEKLCEPLRDFMLFHLHSNYYIPLFLGFLFSSDLIGDSRKKKNHKSNEDDSF